VCNKYLHVIWVSEGPTFEEPGKTFHRLCRKTVKQPVRRVPEGLGKKGIWDTSNLLAMSQNTAGKLGYFPWNYILPTLESMTRCNNRLMFCSIAIQTIQWTWGRISGMGTLPPNEKREPCLGLCRASQEFQCYFKRPSKHPARIEILFLRLHIRKISHYSIRTFFFVSDCFNIFIPK